MKKAHILIFFFLTFSILFAESKPKSNLKKISKSQPSIPTPKEEEKVHSKEYYDDLVEKGLIADKLTGGKPPHPSYKKMNFTEDKQRRREILKDFKKKNHMRKLTEAEQTLENLGFIGLIQEKSSSDSNKAMRFITNNIQKDDSRFILYPYPFDYTTKVDETIETKSSEEGGVFTLNQTALNGQTFKYIQNISSVQIGKAKGIYDIDIAILSMVYVKNGMEVDLLTEASNFCNYFQSTIAKTTSCLEGKVPYLEYKQKNPSKGAVVRVSAADILNQTLFDSTTKQLKFKLLIVPDYLTGNEETIFSANYLKNEAVEVIKEFRNLFGFREKDYSNAFLLRKLKENNSNFEKAHNSIFKK